MEKSNDHRLIARELMGLTVEANCSVIIGCAKFPPPLVPGWGVLCILSPRGGASTITSKIPGRNDGFSFITDGFAAANQGQLESPNEVV